MSRVTGSSLIFDEDEVKATSALLPRLIRIFFYGEGITNDDYISRYGHYFRGVFPDKTQKEFSQKAAADRKFLLDRRKITFSMLSSVINAMGYNIEGVSIRVSDRLTGETTTFSTDDTVDKLKERIEKSKEIGIQSII